MEKSKLKKLAWLRRKKRVRKKIKGTPDRPRLTVYRSLKHIYAQLVDDVSGRTITGVSSLTPSLREKLNNTKGKVAVARMVGQAIAQKALERGIKKVVFDRNGFVYHGRVRAVAEGAREAGLEF